MRLIVILPIVGLACGRLNFEPLEALAPSDGATDGAAACTTFGPWGPPDLLALSTDQNDLAPALHPDGLTLVFDSVVNSRRALHIARRSTTSGPFGTPQLIANLTNGDDNMQPAWSPDGKTVHWHRLGTANDRMLADYDGDIAFSNPRLDDLPVNTDNHSFSLDQLEVFFTHYPASANVGHARRTAIGAAWVTDTEVDALNTGSEEGYPAFDEARQALYIERDIGGGITEIAVATRPNPTAPFGAPTTVPELVINNGNNGDPEVSRDGTTLLFASIRPGTQSIDVFETRRTCLD